MKKIILIALLINTISYAYEIKNLPIIVLEPNNILNAREYALQNKLQNNNNYKLDISLEYSPILLAGDFKLGLTNNKIDLENNLKIEDTENTMIPLLSIKKDNHKVLLSYLSNRYKNTNILNKDILLDNHTYTTNTSIDSTIKTNWIDLGYRYHYLFTNIGFSIHSYENNIKIESNTDMTTTVDGAYMFYTLGFDNKLNYYDFLISYGGSIGKGSEVDYLSYYLSLGTEVYFIEDSSLSLGYKVKELDIEDNNYESNLQYSGIYLNFIKEF